MGAFSIVTSWDKFSTRVSHHPRRLLPLKLVFLGLTFKPFPGRSWVLFSFAFPVPIGRFPDLDTNSESVSLPSLKHVGLLTKGVAVSAHRRAPHRQMRKPGMFQSREEVEVYSGQGEGGGEGQATQRVLGSPLLERRWGPSSFQDIIRKSHP